MEEPRRYGRHRGMVVLALGLQLCSPVSLRGADRDAVVGSTPVLVIDAAAHTAPIRQIAADVSETQLVTVADDKSARLWDIAGGTLLATFRPPVGPEQIGRLYGVAVSAGGKLALAGTTAPPGGVHRIYLYELASRAFDRVIDARGGDVKRLQWSPDGRLLAAAYAGAPGFRVFTADGGLVYEEVLPADAWSLAFSRGGQVAVPVSDGTVRLYSVAEGAVRREGVIRTSLPDPRGVQFSPDGRLLAVGYLSRQSRTSVQVDVFDVSARTLVRSFAFSDVTEGNLRNVAWQSDGSAIYAGGSGYRGRNSFVVKRIGWPQGVTSDLVVATNSITDLLPMRDGRMMFATSEASWGVLDGQQMTTTVATIAPQFFDATAVQIDKDARQVSWRARPNHQVVHFDVMNRLVRDGAGAATLTPKISSLRVWVVDWENNFHPRVGGGAIPMQPTEVSRAVAVLPDHSALILATSRTLRRLKPDGAAVWSVPLATEARTVNVSEDGKVLVTGMMDGTIVWRRTVDGAILLSLFAAPGGRWVLWTGRGYYDASVGAENLVGWLVSRASGEQADFYDLSRFRDKYFRPDVVDRILVTQDETTAIAAANAERKQLAAKAGPVVQQRVDQLIAEASVKAILPPVVTLVSPAVIESADTTVAVDYRVLNHDPTEPTSISVRVDGRPYNAWQHRPPARTDGEAVGRLVFALQAKGALVQIFASNRHSISAPAAFDFRLKPRPITPATSLVPAAAESPATGAQATLAAPAAPAPGALATAPAPEPATSKSTIPATSPAPAALTLPTPAAVPEKEPAGMVPPPTSIATTPVPTPVASPALSPADPSPPAPVVAPAPTPATVAQMPAAGAGESSAAPVTAPGRQSAATEARPTLYLLAVGVSNYGNPNYNLLLAAKDATDFAKAFQRQSGAFYKTVEVRLLSDERATRKAVIDGLQWLKDITTDADVGVVYVAGHGVNDVDDSYYFLAHDADLAHLSGTGVPESAFREALSSIRGKAIFFVDTCYSGKAVGTLSRTELTRITNKLASPEYGVVVFSGSDGRQQSLESMEWGNGAFTKALVNGVNGAADYRREGVVTHRGLDYYVGYEVTKLTKGQQTPVTMVPIAVKDFGLAASFSR